MNLKRRHFLMFLGAATSSVALEPVLASNKKYSLGLADEIAAQNTAKSSTKLASNLNFTPIQTPIPLGIENTAPQQQIQAYSTYDVQDNLVLPEEFTYDVIAAWGDRVGDSRFGYNNDYLVRLV